MGKSDKEALEEFLLDIDCLDGLNEWIDNQNIFEILKLVTTEIRHSNFLAWLFDANAKHSFGENILRDVVCKIITNNKEFCEEKNFNIIDVSTWDFGSFLVYRELDHIDLLMVSDKERVVLCFENKVFSSEHDDQLNNYMKKVNDRYSDYSILYVYLTPHGDAASNDEWLSFSYGEIINILEKNKAKLKLTVEENIFLDNYINIVRRYIMDDEKLKKVCSEIYMKHKQALDLIYENIPNASNILFENFTEKFKEVALEKGISFDLPKTTKSWIRFNTEHLLNVLPPFDDERLSDWGTKNTWYYEIKNEKNNWKLQLSFNRKDLTDEEVTQREELYKKISNGKEMGKFNIWKSYTIDKNILPKNLNLELVSYDEIYAETDELVEQIINKVLKEISVLEEKTK